MSKKMLPHVMAFAATPSGKQLLDAFLDYWKSYLYREDSVKYAKFANEIKNVDNEGKPLTFDMKEKIVNDLLKQEVITRSGVSYAKDEPIARWFNHPNVKFETFAIVEVLIDMILPDTIIDSIGAYSDVRVAGWGDSFDYKIKPRDLFPVTLVGRGQRKAELQRQYNGHVTLVPQMHEVSVQVSLYRVLAGLDSLSDFVAKAVRSMETQLTVDAYTSFATAMDALSTSGATQLKYTGYTQSVLVSLCQKVTAYNQGAKAVVLGTQLAVQQVLPIDPNYRYDLQSIYVQAGALPHAFGYDIIMLPQVAAWANPFSLVLDDTKLWVVSPSSTKIVQVAMEGNTLSNTSDMFGSSMLEQDTTLFKSWTTGVATNSIGGEISLS